MKASKRGIGGLPRWLSSNVVNGALASRIASRTTVGTGMVMIAVVGLAGCTAPPANASFIAPMSPADAVVISNCVSSFMEMALPPARSTIVIAAESGNDQRVVSLLSGDLRRAGFAVAGSAAGLDNAETVSLVVSPLDTGFIVVVNFGGQVASSYLNRGDNGALQLSSPFLARGDWTPQGIVPGMASTGVVPPKRLAAGGPLIAPDGPETTVAPQGSVSTPPPAQIAHEGRRKSSPRRRAQPQLEASQSDATARLNEQALKAAQSGSYPMVSLPPRAPASAVRVATSANPPAARAAVVTVTKASQAPSLTPPAIGAPVSLLPASATVASAPLPPITTGLQESAASAAPPPPLAEWNIQSGSLIGKDLTKWGSTAGWTVLWQCTQDWSAPASAAFQGDFKTAATAVITALATEGADIRAAFHEGNHVLVVFQPGQEQSDAQ